MQTKTKLELVRQHVSKANGLPNEHYVDPYIFEEEKNSILFNNWAGLDVCSEVPNLGDSKPINFLGLPLFFSQVRQLKFLLCFGRLFPGLEAIAKTHFS